MSTGALAKGDFRAAWQVLRQAGVPVVEFSALREVELEPLVEWLSAENVGNANDVSVHAPSRRDRLSEAEFVRRMRPLATRGWRIVAHPNVIETPRLWREFGPLLCIENMDKRVPGRTHVELADVFRDLPDASLCLDLGHARQVDPTMGVARGLLRGLASRLAEIHVSEVDSRCRHRRLSVMSVWAFGPLARLVPEDVPVIVESEVLPEELPAELATAARCFAGKQERAAVEPTFA